MKSIFTATALFVFFCIPSSAIAQRGGGQRGGGQRGGGQGGGRRPPPSGMQAMPQTAQNQVGFDQSTRQPFGNQNQNQSMPTAQQLAQMMLARFDQDGSGELSQAELQSGLAALQQMMMRNGQGNGGQAAQQAGAANGRQQQNAQFGQAAGNRRQNARGQNAFQRGR